MATYRASLGHTVTPCGNHTVLVQVPLILEPALLRGKAGLLCSGPSKLRKKSTGRLETDLVMADGN